MESLQIRPIATLATPYRDKFGVPRQPGLVPAATGRLVFEPAYRREEAVRGLDQFSHLWLIFVFSGVAEGEERLSVRPPRLGGNQKLGVFATRSPFRPNRLGLSACRLERIDWEDSEGPVLVLAGVDLVDGTPIVDVKPYLPYADGIAGAESRLASEPPAKHEVRISAEAKEEFEALSSTERDVVLQTLSLDARPAFHEEGRTYFLRLFDYDVAWRFVGDECEVVAIRKFDSSAG